MNTRENYLNKQNQSNPSKNILPVTLALFVGVLLLAIGLFAIQIGSGTSPLQLINGFLGLDNVHIWWYISRASGLMAYLLLWFSTIWGFAISSKILDSFMERMFTYDFHEHISLLSLGFLLVHLISLLLDRVQPMSLVEVLIPFVSTYRPFWTGIGIIAFYLSILVTVTFYIRSLISMKTFRTIHYASILAYLGGLFHGLYAGTDSVLNWTQLMYWGTFLSTIFFGVYWLAILRLRKGAPAQQLQTQRKS